MEHYEDPRQQQLSERTSSSKNGRTVAKSTDGTYVFEP